MIGFDEKSLLSMLVKVGFWFTLLSCCVWKHLIFGNCLDGIVCYWHDGCWYGWWYTGKFAWMGVERVGGGFVNWSLAATLTFAC